MENPETNNNSENQDKSNYPEIINSLRELLKDINFFEILKSNDDVRNEKIKSLNNTNNINLSFWTRKFIKEFAVLSIILIAICYLAYNKQIDTNSLGTLLGSIIGYAVGNFNSSNKEH